jgi:CBS domain-containing protein
MTRCEDIMTSDVLCCFETDNLQEVAQRMDERNVGALPVVGHLSGKLIGIVTDRDLALRVIGNGLDVATTLVDYVMTPDVITCYPHDVLDLVMATMSEWKVRRLPVVNEDSQVVGIIAQADLATRLKERSWAGAVVKGISQPDSTPQGSFIDELPEKLLVLNEKGT